MPRAALSFKFRVEEVPPEGRAFEDVLPATVAADAVGGLVGALGYTAQGEVAAAGKVYRVQGEEVMVHGRLQAAVGFTCGRCLNERELTVDAPFEHLLVKRKPGRRDDPLELVVDEALLEEPDVEAYEGEHIDLNDLIREDLVLAMPMNPSCDDAAVECPGFAAPAPAEAPEGERIDPRWAPLLALKQKLEQS